MVEGAPHTAKGSMINLCVLGCPLPPYIKEQGGRPAGPVGRARRSPFPTPTRRRTPLQARHKGWPASPLLLYIRGQGAPENTQVDH